MLHWTNRVMGSHRADGAWTVYSPVDGKRDGSTLDRSVTAALVNPRLLRGSVIIVL